MHRGATLAEIKAAYRSLARQHHPDVAASRSQADFALISNAYQILSDPSRRDTVDIDPVLEARQATATSAALVKTKHSIEAMQVLLAADAFQYDRSALPVAAAALVVCARGRSITTSEFACVKQLWLGLLAVDGDTDHSAMTHACNAFFAIALRRSDFKLANEARRIAESAGYEQTAEMRSFVWQVKRYAATIKEGGK